MLGWRTRCAVEIDSYARKVLLARQADGMLEKFPIWDDVRTFDGRPWRQAIDVVSGGFPCQDISAAGKGGGLAGKRSGLWFEMLRIIGEVKPRFVFAENSPNLRTRGLGTVIEGLAGLGYDVRWCVLGARHVGAPHQRNRIWILASDADGATIREQSGRRGWQSWKGSSFTFRDGSTKQISDTESTRCEEQRSTFGGESKYSELGVSGWWTVEPSVGRVAYGLGHRVDRLRAIGNGQVPRVAAEAFTILSDGWI